MDCQRWGAFDAATGFRRALLAHSAESEAAELEIETELRRPCKPV
jgi:hypothetical protein